ncbi:MAG: O-antigen ligase family protein [Planctomycetota bacterium]
MTGPAGMPVGTQPALGDRVLRMAVITVIAAVLFALTFPHAPVYRDLVKLYLFHLIGWPLAIWVWGSGRVRVGVTEAVLAAFLAANGAAVLWSPYPEYAWDRLSNLALGAVWFTVVRAAAAGPAGREWLLAALHRVGIVLALTGLTAYWGLPVLTGAAVEYRMVFPVGDPNSFGLVLVPVIGLGCWYAFDAARRGRRRALALHLTGLLAAVGAFIAARSQAAAIGLAAGAVVFALAALHAAASPIRRRWVVVTALLLAVAAGGLAAAAYPCLGGTFVVRRFCWEAGLRMIEAHPWGAGPGTAGALLPAFLDPVWHVTAGFGDYVYHLHNEYLEIGVEAGVAGLLLWLVFFGLVMAAYYRDCSARFWPGAVAGRRGRRRAGGRAGGNDRGCQHAVQRRSRGRLGPSRAGTGRDLSGAAGPCGPVGRDDGRDRRRGDLHRVDRAILARRAGPGRGLGRTSPGGRAAHGPRPGPGEPVVLP